MDLNTGRYEAVAAVPGFTRGLDFAGDLAFVGLSQVRESAVFSGLPLQRGRHRIRHFRVEMDEIINTLSHFTDVFAHFGIIPRCLD